MTENLLKHAIEYAKRGWFVFPTRERPSKPFTYITKSGKEKTKILPVKSPYYKGGFMNATLDIEQIKKWWNRYPEAGIGISCGASNLVVVDIDVHNKNVNGFDNWMKLNISDEGALHAMSPSGGLHIVYKGLCNSYGDKNYSVDVRSIGAYILAPPSFVYLEDGSKGRYVAVDDWSCEPVDVPYNLMEKLNILRGKNKKDNKRLVVNDNTPIDKKILKAKEALNKLPQEYCDEYFKWINVAIALKSGLGDSGFKLFDEWSKKSEKYDEDEVEYKWERIVPREIGLGSLFFWAKESKE
jgi:putative DNA primase/helicase